MKKVIVEKIAPGMTRSWDIDVLVSQKTNFQQVDIGYTSQGISLFLDNERQSTEATQLIYHEALVFPPLLTNINAASAFVIGSTEGVVPLLLRQAGLSHIEHVDLDPTCFDLCRRYLPYGYFPGFEIPSGISVSFGDGIEYLKLSPRKYDLIISDITDLPDDPSIQSTRLYGTPFFDEVRSKLNFGGTFITQAGNSAAWRNDGLRRIYRAMKEVFPTVIYWEQEEQDWSFLLGLQEKQREKAIIELMIENFKKLPIVPQHIDEKSILKSTILPHTLRTLDTY